METNRNRIQGILLTSLLLLLIISLIMSWRSIKPSKEQQQLLQKDEELQLLDQRSRIQQTPEGEEKEEEDKEWSRQKSRYNFTCMHSKISKNYQPALINKPGGFLQSTPSKRSPTLKQLNFDKQTHYQNHEVEEGQQDKEKQKKQQEMIQNDQLSPTTASNSPIKISLDYSGFVSAQDELNKEKVKYLQNDLLPEVINSIRNIISIKSNKSKQTTSNQPNYSKVFIPYGECFKVEVPKSHKENGLDTDLILYVTNYQEGTIWGVVCVRDFGNAYRPVAAQLNINIENIIINNHQFNQLQLTHELIHILGFSQNSLELSQQQSAKGQIIKQSQRYESKKVLNANILKNYASAYFNCTGKADNNLEGIYLEDEQDADQDIHFEKTLLMNDVMTSELHPNSMISPLSIKTLESTGWYSTNIDHLISYNYLLLSGCLPLTNFTQYYEENEIPNQKNINYFNQSKQIRKQIDYSHSKHSNQQGKGVEEVYDVAKNTTKKEKKLINEYDNGVQGFCNQNNFNSTAKGCSYDLGYRSACKISPFSNKYAILYPLETGSCLSQNIPSAPTSTLFNSHSLYQNITGEVFSNSSYCFESNLLLKQGSPTNSHDPQEKQQQPLDSTRCFQAKCNENQTQIEMQIFNKTLTCTENYQVIQSPLGMEGQIVCPNIQQLCLIQNLRKYTSSNQPQ